MSELLQSWKEIAAYLRRSVRTAQRWERQFGLPVHRPAGADRTAVMAVPEEIDRWAANTRLFADSIDVLKSRIALLQAENLQLQEELQRVKSGLIKKLRVRGSGRSDQSP